MQIPAESAASVPGRKSGKLRIRRAVAAGAAGAAVAAVAGGIATPAFARPAAQPAPVSVASYQLGGARSANAVRTAAYWSHSRMLSARNADVITARPSPAGTHPAPSGPAGRVAGAVPSQGLTAPRAVPKTGPTGTPWNGNTHLPPATTSGKVFFTTTGNGVRENWVCSASAVNSGGKDTVFTAGHCVYGSLGGEVNYVSNQDEGDDIGAAVMNANSAGQHLVNVVGGQGIAWNYGANQYIFDFGYPAAPPFNGLTLQECDGGEFNFSVYASSTMELTCNFTGGSSGGPWLMSFGGEFGYVNGVNDFTVNGLSGKVFSAYFGNNAAALYNVTASL
jgi:hypothetical protein